LKANGEIPCDDDFGEQMVLGWVPRQGPFSLIELFSSEKYQHIQDAFVAGTMPWGRICARCALNRPADPPDSHLSQRFISYFQIETTLACALLCPCCSRTAQLKHRPGPHVLDLKRFRVLLSALKEEGFHVQYIDYCGQGEPLDHPGIETMIAELRTVYPVARQRIVTNGNHVFSEKLADSFVEELMVSVDGATQESYEKYRVRGDYCRTLTSMKEARKSRHPYMIIWKYILFEHNDSIEEIALAQKIAEDIGVDQLMFVRTHSAGRSSKWDHNALPLTWSRAIDSATPHIQRAELDI
jgi:molybdenum cofactor biosynthesis enzyme MoaA